MAPWARRKEAAKWSVESETKEMRQGVGTGGNAAREGGRDACGGSGARSLWLCGTEKCPFDFATDGDSANSENTSKARMDLLLSFSTADAVDIRNELT